ncbi:hypothetical protein CWI84_10815 [Idiomarina tyrosinivorans]|uniref:YggT family protein n=1 Tax=Idiomarina tyrosinivorans TaxID=1445662 RepID=A0A432ZK17_9GAMM|nr:YggT family protein [Idiomarina tyrosinivorans]RUO78170.1 hypothetical protein CWI84_10815 [Idiomarina tyrosinivorans]
MNNALTFLVVTIIDLYLYVVLLRLWMQATRADFYNPVSQFVVKATQPVVGLLRNLLPTVGRVDLATLIFAYAIGVLKVYAIIGLNNYGFSAPALFINGFLMVVSAFLSMIFWILVIRALLSWFSQGYNPIEALLHQLTEPLLAPVRKILPPLGGLDLSVLVVLLLLQFLRILIGI